MILNFIVSGIILTTPILLAASGDLYCEKSGVLNLGIEALMILGAYVSYHIAYFSGNVYYGLIMAIAIGAAAGALQGLFTVTLKCDQVIYGVAANILALGITSTLFRTYFGVGNGYPMSTGLPAIKVPLLSSIPYVGEIFSRLTILFYIGIVFLILTIIIFYFTSAGLKIRASGDNPHAADTLGINVPLTRYVCLIISGVFGALGGASLTIGDLHFFQDGMTAGRGYIALAAVIFGRYHPGGVMMAALLFGMVDAFQLRMQIAGEIPYQLFLALPYFITIMALYVVGAGKAPKYHSKPFIRGER